MSMQFVGSMHLNGSSNWLEVLDRLQMWHEYAKSMPRVFLSAEPQTDSFNKFSMKNMYPLVNIQKPMENHYVHRSINYKWAIFYSYVGLLGRVGVNETTAIKSGSFRIARLLTAEELHGYDLVLGPKSSAEERFFSLD